MRLHSVKQTLIVAHRGASHAAPENTLPSFELAFKEGADFIEGDFWLTKEEAIVCIHDPDTERVSADHIKLDVRSSTLSDLRKLDFGGWKGKKFIGERIPTLEEILQILHPNRGLFLEIKDPRPRFLDRLADVLHSFNMTPQRLRLMAFDPKVVHNARKKFPDFKIYWLYNWYLAQETGTLSNSPHEILKILHILPCDGLNINPVPWIDIDFVHNLRKMNMDFCVYNVNTFAETLKLLTLGVDAIATNYPGKLRKEINAYFSPASFSNQKNEYLELGPNRTIKFKNTFE